METIERKARIRLVRGILNDFYSLPFEHQEKFKTIKSVICDLLGSQTNVYVFGSFYWGIWDEYSDYDVLLDYTKNIHGPDERMENVFKAKTRLKEEYGLSVDIMTMKGIEGILIP